MFVRHKTGTYANEGSGREWFAYICMCTGVVLHVTEHRLGSSFANDTKHERKHN